MCGDAILNETLTNHSLEDHCREPTLGISKCPLCHGDVYLPKDNGWNRHLMKCSANIKRRSKIN